MTLTTSSRRRAAGWPADDRALGTPVWARDYASRLAATDATAVALAGLGAVAQPLGHGWGRVPPLLAAVLLALAVGWLLVLGAGATRDRRIVGKGPAEYVRVATLSWQLFTAVAVVGYLTVSGPPPAELVVFFLLGTVLLLLGRMAWRRWLHRRRDDGEYQSRMVVVGTAARIETLVRELALTKRAGYRPVGAYLVGQQPDRPEQLAGVPVRGGLEAVAEVAADAGVDAVAVTGADDLGPDVVRRLGWDLERTGTELIMAPALTAVAGPRVMVSPVTALPLMHVEAPRFTGGKYVLKTAFDTVGAAVLLALLSPVLLVTALLVKLTSEGPVWYRQTRVGRDGERFEILKFRSMYRDADRRLDEVMADGVGLFYKRADDPRITPVGRVIRRFSIDELPQLVNVLRGDMSLVGPRPQIDREVALYDRHAHRRLLVKPGLTGLWQVSGRSSLSPEESIRLDVFYVENWTLVGDLLILARTLRAVVGREGAY